MEAVINMVKSVDSGNKEMFLASIHIPAGAEDAATAMFEQGLAMSRFEKAFVAAYGEAAAGRVIPGSSSQPISEKLEAIQANGQVAIDGDRATVRMGGEPEGMGLMRVDGAWKVDLSEAFTQMAPTDMALMMRKMAEAYDIARAKIGQPDMTAEKVEQELQRAMMIAMTGMEPPEASPGEMQTAPAEPVAP
jgi:hypothetical protein